MKEKGDRRKEKALSMYVVQETVKSLITSCRITVNYDSINFRPHVLAAPLATRAGLRIN